MRTHVQTTTTNPQFRPTRPLLEEPAPTGFAAIIRECTERLGRVRPSFVVSVDPPENAGAAWGVSIEDLEAKKTVIFWEGGLNVVVTQLDDWLRTVEQAARTEVPAPEDLRGLLLFLETPPHRREAAVYKTLDGLWNLRITGQGPPSKIFKATSVKACVEEFLDWVPKPAVPANSQH